MAMGTLAGDYLLNRRAAAYLPARYVKRYLDRGEMYLVPDAPRFPYPVWAIWHDDMDDDLRAVAGNTLRALAKLAEKDGDQVLESLADLSEDHQVDVLGEEPVFDLDQ
jgi:hypothetical protein